MVELRSELELKEHGRIIFLISLSQADVLTKNAQGSYLDYVSMSFRLRFPTIRHSFLSCL